MEKSTGILVYRIINDEIQVLLGKCGGPQWKNRSVGAWNIPKGHVEENETDLECAIREFNEETSLSLNFPNSCDELLDLGWTSTNSGKMVKIFAIEHNFTNDVSTFKVDIKSNMAKTEWPPKSGNMIVVPELSDAYYFKLSTAKRMIFPYQKIFLEKLEELLAPSLMLGSSQNIENEQDVGSERNG